MSDIVERLKRWEKYRRNWQANVGRKSAEMIFQDMEDAADHIESQEREIDALRSYGNKDCTAMADEFLSEEEYYCVNCDHTWTGEKYSICPVCGSND